MYVHQLPGSGGSLWAVWVWGEGQIGASCVVRDLAGVPRDRQTAAAAAANVFHMFFYGLCVCCFDSDRQLDSDSAELIIRIFYFCWWLCCCFRV